MDSSAGLGNNARDRQEECSAPITELVMAKCSYCGKENDDQVEVCAGCGTAMTPSAAVLPPTIYSPLARKRIIRGAAWLFAGLVVTAVTYSSARSGGTYVVAWGAIAFGSVQLFQGLLAGRRPPRLEKAGYDEFELATRPGSSGPRPGRRGRLQIDCRKIRQHTCRD